MPLLKLLARHRREQLLTGSQLADDDIPDNKVHRVSSANSLEAQDLLQKLNPQIVIVSGTRILSKALLSKISCPIINMHAGITPKYRGVHGAYWAFAQGLPDLAGVTVHYVDAGIDTGKVIMQALVKKTEQDNFTTYPILQIIAGLPLLEAAVKDILAGGHPESVSLTQESSLWSHPTVFEYLYFRFSRGVK